MSDEMRAEWDAKQAARPSLPLPKRWPTKPRADQRCEALVGVHSGQFGEPLLDRCPNNAVETVLATRLWHWAVYLCADCVTQMSDIIRNPRLTK